ncbi:MAG: transposase [Rikenellaceae bacterium]
MYFISQARHNPKTGQDDRYYRLKESYRDVLGKVHSYILLNVGFIEGLKSSEIGQVAKGLTYMSEHLDNETLLGKRLAHYSPIVQEHIHKYWRQIKEAGKIDVAKKTLDDARSKARNFVDLDTVEHTDAREIGAENLCLQALKQLKFDTFLRTQGWSEQKIETALAHLIVRTIYAPSEHKSLRIMDENSAACELITKSPNAPTPSKRAIYDVAPELHKLKDQLERHLCQTTDDLFNLTNRIMIFDLTNFFFEGRKEGSTKAQFGRSKEKRTDCKLVVLALCVNAEGFIRYSSILEGNTADPMSLPDMIENLIAKNPVSSNPDEKVLVVLDAGISTEENLQLIKDKGYNYLCVSRTRLKNYELSPDKQTVIVHDCKQREIKLRANIKTLDEKTTWDYYNLIREIESTNRQLKTDLQLRPIYHQRDDNSDAHLFFGLLAYWVVNTIRYQLKRQGVNHYWTEIVRIMSTQKAVTMEATNALGERVRMRVCSRPTEKAARIYKSLGYSNMPFRRMRIEDE